MARAHPLISLALCTLLAGCSLSPGMQLKVNGPSDETELDEPVQEDGYLLVPLRPKVLQKLQAQTPAGTSLRGVPDAWRFDPKAYNYRVGAGDILAVTVWEHPELTNPAAYQTPEGVGQRVSPDGTMFYPYAGTLDVAQRTVEEIRVQIASRLTQYIKNPQVDVRVIGFRSKRVHVTGAVRAPKDLPITDVPLTLVDAINGAGGPTIGEPTGAYTAPEADLDGIRVIRNGQELQVSLLDIYHHAALDQNVILQDGDVVYVPDKRNKEIYVMGEVNRQGVQYLANGRLTLAAALQLAGGMNQETANAERIFVIRQGDKQTVVYHLNADEAASMILATRFQLQPHDVIFVSSADMTRVRRVLTPIVQAMQIFFFGSFL